MTPFSLFGFVLCAILSGNFASAVQVKHTSTGHCVTNDGNGEVSLHHCSKGKSQEWETSSKSVTALQAHGTQSCLQVDTKANKPTGLSVAECNVELQSQTWILENSLVRTDLTNECLKAVGGKLAMAVCDDSEDSNGKQSWSVGDFKFVESKYSEDKEKFPEEKYSKEKFPEEKYSKDKFPEDKFPEDKFHEDKYHEEKETKYPNLASILT